jgi:hypothetical protein
VIQIEQERQQNSDKDSIVAEDHDTERPSSVHTVDVVISTNVDVNYEVDLRVSNDDNDDNNDNNNNDTNDDADDDDDDDNSLEEQQNDVGQSSLVCETKTFCWLFLMMFCDVEF